MLPAVMVNIFAIMLFLFLYYKLDINFPGRPVLLGISSGAGISVLLATIITSRWKISLHALGMGILSGFTLAYYQQMNEFYVWVLPLVLLLSGWVLAMRMYLGAHDLKQSIVGFFIGFVLTFLSLKICLYYYAL
jgi:membrane-associated phospholipid phosphatase